MIRSSVKTFSGRMAFAEYPLLPVAFCSTSFQFYRPWQFGFPLPSSFFFPSPFPSLAAFSPPCASLYHDSTSLVNDRFLAEASHHSQWLTPCLSVFLQQQVLQYWYQHVTQEMSVTVAEKGMFGSRARSELEVGFSYDGAVVILEAVEMYYRW